MNSIDQIATLNNQGCDELDAGNLNGATVLFKTALLFLRDYLTVYNRIHNTVDRRPPSTLHLSPLSLRMLSKSASRPAAYAARTAQNRISPIHSDAIRLIPGFCFSNDFTENHTIYSAFVIFNLAIVFHVQGLQTCSKRSLEQARSLYSHIMQLIGSTINENFKRVFSEENAAFDLLVLGLFNNVAHMHMEFSEFESATTTFQNLVRYASLSSSFSRSDEEGRYQRRESLEGDSIVLANVEKMVLYASVVGLTSNSVAPAA